MQRTFKTDSVGARLFQSQDRRRRMPELLLCVGARLLDVRHAVNKVAPAKNWDEQVAILGLCRNLSLLLRLKIDNHVRFADCMIDFVNRVGNESAVLLMKSAYLQQARARSF